MDEQPRPVGITILGIAGFVVGAWQLLLSMFALAYSSSMVMIGALSGFPAELAPAYAPLQNIGLDLLAMAGAVVWLVGSAGLWSMQRWAYWLAVAGASVSLLAHVLPRLSGIVSTTSAVSVLICAAILIYMAMPSTRHAFFGMPASDLPPTRA